MIDPALLVHEFDRFTLREGVRLAFRFVGSSAWKDYVLEPSGLPPNLDINNDAQLDAYLQANAVAGFHSVGSAAMSPKGARWGVTDPDLKVKGVRGIRVVDASVIVKSLSFSSLTAELTVHP